MALLRNASMKPAFFGGAVDAKMVLFLFPLALHPSWSTLYLCMAAMAFYATLSHFGLTASTLYRKFRVKCRGSIVYATPLMWKKRKI